MAQDIDKPREINRGALSIDVARAASGHLSLEEVEALHRVSASELTELLSEPAFVSEVTAARARMRLDGQELEALAAGVLPDVIKRLRSVVDDPDSSAGQVIEAGKLAASLSNHTTRAQTRAKQELASEGVSDEPFIVNIIVPLPDGSVRTTVIEGKRNTDIADADYEVLD